MLHHLVTVASQFFADVTPTPTPTSVSDDTVTPGPVGFLATAFVAFATIGLIYDAVRRIRRMRYREEIDQKLEAELAAQHQIDKSEILSNDAPH